jgi:hypothetical protein
MEACTLTLYQNNIFRVTGLPVDATSKEVSRQAQKLQMLEEMGGGSTGPQSAFPLAVPPTTDEIRAALSRMKEPEHRMVDEFFWYWPEEFGASKSDPAIQAMLAGDAEGAVRLWREREKSGSHVAQHNMAILYHMYAVDWTVHHVAYGIDQSLDDQVQGYWRKSFDRWEPLVDSDNLWDMLKERVRSLDDEALTTGFVRRMLKQLPEALDRVNAEAALRFAEQGRIDCAKFHVNFMRETHPGRDDVDTTSEMVLQPTKRRVEQHLDSFKKQTEKAPERGAELAIQLLERCRPMMDLFDLFHGQEAHQRNDLFDQVAETVLQMIIDHQKSTNDNKTFVDLLHKTLGFASGTQLRERIIKNISIGDANIDFDRLRPILDKLENIVTESCRPNVKLQRIKSTILPELPKFAANSGSPKNTSNLLLDSVANALRSISVDAHNDSKDYNTALEAIEIAARLAVDSDNKKRIDSDLTLIRNTVGTSLCFYCGKKNGEAKRKIDVAMHKVTSATSAGTRYNTGKFSVPRCEDCYQFHRRHWKVMWAGAIVGAIAGTWFIPWAAVGGAGLMVLILGGWISYLLLKDSSDGRIGCFGIGATLFGLAACASIAEEDYGQSIASNMLGGAILGSAKQ